ncbi:MAG: PQQ-binding-like beta-propeller repeat protein [Planctomycetota bacterium]|nr:PQQ-binding-like beta-propeller repeat protein [Planctomycetota bacterium]
MAKRLLVTGLLISLTVACESTDNGKRGDMGSGAMSASDSTAVMGRDATEAAMMSLGDGRLLRIDLNEGRAADKRIRIAQAHLVGDLLLLETDEAEPRVFALEREGLAARWVSSLKEPSKFPLHGNADAILSTSAHYAQALDALTGRRSMQFVGGALDGLRRPHLELPSTPTGGGVLGNDSFYVPVLPSPGSNKTFESFSLVTGRRGWGYRTSGDLLTAPQTAGGSADPKVYFVTTTGLVTCIDATNYGFEPSGTRWDTLLEAGTKFGISVTEDTRSVAGGVYAVDENGVMYCLNRITGERRWTHATGMIPMGKPMVFGDICVVAMKSGLAAFDAANVSYDVTVIEGTDKGKSFTVRSGRATSIGSGDRAEISLSDKGVAAQHCTLEIQGELLVASSTSDDNTLRADGSRPLNRAVVYSGSTLKIGATVLKITDRGSKPLWTGKNFDGIIGRVGDSLLAATGNTVTLVNAWSGAEGDSATLASGRLMPANTGSANVFVVGGDAVVYALYPR